jgi:hypothetical protein
MKKAPISRKQLAQWFVIGLPVAAVCSTAFFPLLPVVRQGLILVILIWFQVSLLLGVF